jgi:hypothetical protein
MRDDGFFGMVAYPEQSLLAEMVMGHDCPASLMRQEDVGLMDCIVPHKIFTSGDYRRVTHPDIISLVRLPTYRTLLL